MKRRAIIALSTVLLAGGAAVAGINPASPGLPNVTDTKMATQPVANNQGSAMCVDCHTQNPKLGSGAGTHYINTALNGSSNSGGSGVNSGGGAGAAAAGSFRDDGAYYKITAWRVGDATDTWTSKYANGEVSTVYAAPTLNGTALAAGKYNATLNTTNTDFDSYDIICESCHNVVGNANGGNNLLASVANNNYQTPDNIPLCIGCHGFMYSNDATVWAATTTETVQGAAANLSTVGDVNRNEVNTSTTAPKGNNEWHSVLGTAYPQNHHVMTGDAINNAMAAARALWTDNDIVSYTDDPIDNTGGAQDAGKSTYPQKATWSGAGMAKPTNGGVNCTNCHTPAHGHGGSPAASILRNGTYTGAAPASTWSRIYDRAAWKKIKDQDYCNQCHM